MSLQYNPVPALNEEFINLMEKMKRNITELKELAYGPKSNNYDSVHSYVPNEPGKKLMSINEIDHRLSNILTTDNLEIIKKEAIKLRPKIDYFLVQNVVEKILPQWMPQDSLVEYDFYVVGRDMNKIDSKKDPKRGRKDRQVPIKVLPLEEWTSGAWKEYIFLDERAYSEEIKKYMPEDTNCLLSTVHRFYAVRKEGKINHEKNNSFLPGYMIVDDKLQVDCRTKSGAELMWKYIPYLTGLEEKPRMSRRTIDDMSGFRFICRDNFKEKSIDLFQSFMYRYIGDCRGSLKLQVLDKEKYERMKEFLKAENLEKNQITNAGLIKEAILLEDRSDILSSEDVNQLKEKYYLELLLPFSVFSATDKCFEKNIFNGLGYQVQTFKKIHEKRDDFIYKGRAEDWRDEHYSYLEWRLAEILAPVLLTGDSERYITYIAKSKLNKKSKIFSI